MRVGREAKVGLLAALMIILGAPSAWAGPNDLRLSRFGEFKRSDYEGCTDVCGVVETDDEGFSSLMRDVGQVFAPRLIAPSETLGQAGFAVQFMTSFTLIPNEEEYWQRGVEGRSPAPAMFTSHLQVRKGLPFSFEVVGNLGYLFASEMFSMGADIRWALNEGFAWFPDVAVRGSVNTVVGAPELNMVNAGWDMSISKSFGLGGVAAATPYIGYQQLFTMASTRVLNAYPQDPRPPQFSTSDPNVRFGPEFVFGNQVSQVSRFFLGARLNVWLLSFTLEGIFGPPGGDTRSQFTFAGGFDF